MNPLVCFVRARLQRRLFVWFGSAILLAMIAASSVIVVSQHGGSAWGRPLGQLGVFAGGRFARVWDDPAAREELAQAIRADLDLTVTLEDAVQRPIATFGAPCSSWRPRPTPVLRNGVPIGYVAFCVPGHGGPLRTALPLLVVLFVLWAASGRMARRLARPIVEVARVASALGAGDLRARVRIGRHMHGEAVALASTINTMAERIERAMAEQRQLLAAVSHELRTPLARIRLLTELARGGADVGKSLDELDREVVEIDALVGDLLASSRMDFAALSRRPIPAAEAAGRALERAGVDPSLLAIAGDEAEAEALRVEADATLLARALANLIDNAKKHGGGVAALRVGRVRRVGERDGEGDGIAFEVEDRGSGFLPGEEERVFEPFYRRSENGSLGLGLALVKRIAEAHGGSAYAENIEGGGARVGIRLPRSQPREA